MSTKVAVGCEAVVGSLTPSKKKEYRVTNRLQEGKRPLYAVVFNFLDSRYFNLFATVGGNRVTVYQCLEGGVIAVLQSYVDDDKNESFYTVTWAYTLDGAPLLVAGGINGIIRVIDVGNEKIHKMLLGLYQPFVWEYSRLNVTNTVMSKRKLKHLVTENWVDGWDDLRLMTLAGLHRRGVTSTSINAFVQGTGITRSDCTMIRLDRLEYHIREELNKTSPRTMVVIDPLKVVITNMKAGLVMDLDAKKWPDAQTDDASSFYKVPFSNIVYIKHTDFRIKDSKDYYGLAPGKTVLLRYAYPIKCSDVVLADDKETVLEIHAEYDPLKMTKPKGVIHWVAEPKPGVDPLKVEVRLFNELFRSENPAELDDWLGDLNPQSKVAMPCAYAVPTLHTAAVGDSFQFERLGYFVVDKDSTSDKLVFNRTVTLRDSYGKRGK